MNFQSISRTLQLFSRQIRSKSATYTLANMVLTLIPQRYLRF